jgi:heme-degrading monooxygenase HmoA
MQKVLIDTFIVPEASKAPFLETARKVQSLLKTVPGFVEGYLFEKRDGAGRYDYMTTAVWESEAAFEAAQKTVAAEFQKQGINPLETRKKLKIEGERAIYERFPY